MLGLALLGTRLRAFLSLKQVVQYHGAEMLRLPVLKSVCHFHQRLFV